jgi:hypothetical protein
VLPQPPHQSGDWGSWIRILPGAPSANKTANPGDGAAVGQNRLFKDVLSAAYADLVVINVDTVDEGPEVGLPKRDASVRRSRIRVPKAAILSGPIMMGWAARASGPVQRRLCRVAFGRQCRDLVLQDVVQLGNPILYHHLEAPQPVISFFDAFLQRLDSGVDRKTIFWARRA